jgi:hypothetical protein
MFMYGEPSLLIVRRGFLFLDNIEPAYRRQVTNVE